MLTFLLTFALAAFSAAGLKAQTPDTLIFTNGEKLIGHLVQSKANSVTFHSDMAGNITVDWSKIQELHTSGTFAVIPKNVTLHGPQDVGQVPEGPIAATAQQIEVTPAGGRPAQTAAVADTAYVVSDASFQKELHRQGIFQAWKGTVSAGISIVAATQNSRTFNESVSLVRAIPTESWAEPRNRTIVDFNSTSGKLTQPNTPDIKTAIYHVDGERDQYFSSRFFGFGQLAYDHNFSQGLDLQQTYGGGIGYTIINRPNTTLDVKASMDYVRQRFLSSDLGHNLIGSVFGERYNRTLPRGIVLTQQASVTPAWNETSAYSAIAGAGLAVPVYKRLSLTTNLTDTFLNNPPAGFKKNSLQFAAGFGYTLP